ncbi:MAG: hypothetical protein J5543_07230 [Bacteroidales bacterium]|nr:hypothetical protein [Bacteroidales bacterium]
MKKILITLSILITFSWGAFAQPGNGISPEPVDASDATITAMGHLTMTVGREVVVDTLTMRADTLITVKNVEWNTESGTAIARAARRHAKASSFYDQDSDWWLDMWWFKYTYPSINAEGEPVTLSALACMPDEDCDYINNVIIGCHVTITSNKECPSSYSAEGSSASDVSMLMNHAGSGLVIHSTQSNMPYYNLVILPDYEGYGVTRNHPHPYLYQELTARQVVDGVRYGISLYKTDSQVSSIRHAFRDGWRSICVGYSQGGSVAMATHRFIEQNGLTDELQFAGSVCGDGPYDLLSTVMYYVKNEKQGKNLSMPVVMPLILKGMCDSNPYMTSHKVSDYIKPQFLETGILDWLNDKEKTTEDITNAWKELYKNGKPASDPDDEGAYGPTYYHAVLNEDGTSTLSKMMRYESLTYFTNLYDANQYNFTSATGIPLPTKRGLVEDLHLALESNNMTMGWQPQHPMFLYHSYDDTVVPEVNRERAANTIGEWVIKVHASGMLQYDHVGTGRQFFLGIEEFDAIRALAKAPVHPTKEQVSQMRTDFGSNSVDD